MTVLPTIRRQVLQAAERNATAGARAVSWPRWRWWVQRRLVVGTSHLATAALIAVTLVVATGAILLLGHSRHSQVAGRSPTATRQQLLQTLGALRTPATAADRELVACIQRFGNRPGGAKCLRYVPQEVLITENAAPMAHSLLASMGGPRWDLSLIRTIPLGRTGARVTLFPGTWRPYTSAHGQFSSPPSAQRTWGIAAALVDRGYAESPATSVATLRAHGLALLPYAGPSAHLRVAIVVPDGVVKITIATISLAGQRWLENAPVAVHDNVAVLQLRTPGSRFNGLQSETIQMTWFDARGRVIRHTTTALHG